MQFVRNGPDVPERLLQAHEEGRVVFFCGAGISYPAGLPGFEGLVCELTKQVGEPLDHAERALFGQGQFDRVLGLYEQRIQGGRTHVRKWLPEVLKPDLARPRALMTHLALLTLGRSKHDGLKLVTTNFDLLFEKAAEHYHQPSFAVYPDPPARPRWEGLVRLHGRMPANPSEHDLNRLVLSDGDFGQAYLIYGWASRFVAGLLRDDVLCFVGYSLNDPVVRYMTAAHALEGARDKMFVFVPGNKTEMTTQPSERHLDHVTRIVYDEAKNHEALHRTLQMWASLHRPSRRKGQLSGKERIVARYAHKSPKESKPEHDFVGRVLWALSDPSGLPAKRFAELNPVPSLDWLEPLSEKRFGFADLARFGVAPQPVVDDKLSFSLMCRPSPYPLAPLMCAVEVGVRGSQWDDVMRHLATWLTRHLGDPALLLWLVKCGGRLHDEFARQIERRLNEIAKYEREGNMAELARIQEGAPQSIPSPPMRILWRLLLTGRVKSWGHRFDLYRWRDHFNREGLTATLRLELRNILTPCVTLREPFGKPSDGVEAAQPQDMRDLVEWEIVFSTEDVRAVLQNLVRDERWTAALPELLPDFTMLLRDVLDLMRELGGAHDRSDLSSIHQPSISSHPQNHGFRDWTVLIELTRDAWLATAHQSPEQAALAAESWRHIPYPLFKRLAFFAATHDGVIPPRRALDWLLADDHWWLWSMETQREAIRLLVALAPRLDETMLRELEQAILQGPPREMFENTIEPERWTTFVDRGIWLRLAKVAATGVSLSGNAKDRLDALSAQYPQWTLAADDRDEFPFWMGDGSEWRTFQATPRRRKELMEWLKRHPAADHWQEGDWRQLCQDKFPTVVCALYALAKEGVWPVDRWKETFYAWSQKTHRNRSWRLLAPVLAEAPDAQLQALTHPLSYWLKQVAGDFKGHEQRFFTLARRILDLRYEDHEGTTTDDIVEIAINHPVGHVTEALLDWWYRRTLEDGQGLPDEIKSTFTELCDTHIDKFRHGRVLLAAYVITLFRVDRGWATQYLLAASLRLAAIRG